MKIRSLLIGCFAAAVLLSTGSAATFASDPGMAVGIGKSMIISTSADIAAPLGDGWLLAKNDPMVVDPGGSGGTILWFNNITDVAMLDDAIAHDSDPLDTWKFGASMIDVVADTSQLCAIGVGVSTGSGKTLMHSGVALGHVMAPGVLGFNGSSAAIGGPDTCSTFGSAGSGLS